jgi:hypothetical protein
MAMYACSPPRVLPCSLGRSRIKDAELFDDHAGAGLLHPTAGHRISFGPNSNVNSYRLVSGTGANFRGCAREASVNSKKFATVALTSALAFGASSAVAQIDSRTNASTGTGVPTAAAGERSSSASPISGRVYIITKIPKNRLRRANSRSGRSRRMRVSGISPRRAAHPAKRRHHGFGFVPPVHLQAEQPQHGQPLELGLTKPISANNTVRGIHAFRVSELWFAPERPITDDSRLTAGCRLSRRFQPSGAGVIAGKLMGAPPTETGPTGLLGSRGIPLRTTADSRLRVRPVGMEEVISGVMAFCNESTFAISVEI